MAIHRNCNLTSGQKPLFCGRALRIVRAILIIYWGVNRYRLFGMGSDLPNFSYSISCGALCSLKDGHTSNNLVG